MLRLVLALLVGMSGLVASTALYPSPMPITIVLGYNINESPPYFMGEGTRIANPPGISLDIINRAAKQLGINIRYARYPNNRVKSLLQDNSLDGAFIFSFKASRQKMGKYPMKNGKPDITRRMADLGYSLYTLKGSGVRWNGKTITGAIKPVGASRGYSIVGDLKKMDQQVIEGNSAKHNFRKLILNRISATAEQDDTADPLIRSMAYDTIEKLTPALKSKAYYLIFSHHFYRTHPTVAEKLWDKIGEIREQVTKETSVQYLQ